MDNNHGDSEERGSPAVTLTMVTLRYHIRQIVNEVVDSKMDARLASFKTGLMYKIEERTIHHITDIVVKKKLHL